MAIYEPLLGRWPYHGTQRQTDASLIVPKDNADEAVKVDGVKVLQADTLKAVCQHLMNGAATPPNEYKASYQSANYQL